MKKLSILLCLSILACSSFLYSCKKDKDKIPPLSEMIEGTWKLSQVDIHTAIATTASITIPAEIIEELNIQITFNGGKCAMSTKGISVLTGTYRIGSNGKDVIMTRDGSDDSEVIPVQVESGDRFIITDFKDLLPDELLEEFEKMIPSALAPSLLEVAQFIAFFDRQQ